MVHPSLLVVDSPRLTGAANALRDAGLGSTLTAPPAEAFATIARVRPAVVLFDLSQDEPGGRELLHQLRQDPALSEIGLVVMPRSSDDADQQAALELGADDLIIEPTGASLIARVRSQLRLQQVVRHSRRKETNLKTLVELTQALASSLDIRDILYTLVSRVAEIVDVDRCSIVLVHENSDIGHVVASSDDDALRDLPIELSSYPEIRAVLDDGEPLVIQDAGRHALFGEPRQSNPPPEFTSLALAPIVHEDRPMGVIFLRARRATAMPEEAMTLIQAVANTTAIALRNARVLQSLKDASQNDTQARLKAERQMRSFRRYADFFESAADGMVVADHDGKVLFANPRARTILGFTDDNASPFIREILGPDEWRKVSRLVLGFRQGVFPQGVDIRVLDKHGEERILSVNFSSVLHAEHAVLFTFRDVTAQRRTEVELRHTKEFLERMIDSSVDAIVSVDKSGKVVLFNAAAARIFGYAPEDVLGKMDVRALYPPGGAKDVMRKIRSEEYGGRDRLAEYRVDMIDSAGRLVPVKISASLIMDGKSSLGSVGIFTDVRESLRMEAELMRAQEELREQEKGAAVAHLAGATAHELNQPLTSVIGYAELLQRKLDSDSPLYKAAHVILLESARMADIVKKIGRITKYETKSYVGGAQILDLDKAAEEAVEPRI